MPGSARIIRSMLTRLLLIAAVAGALSGCETLEAILLAPDDGPRVVYVQEPSRPQYYDPYYNRPKVYWEPERLYETTAKKTKGNKVYKTTTVKNQYGDTVYKSTKSRKRK